MHDVTDPITRIFGKRPASFCIAAYSKKQERIDKSAARNLSLIDVGASEPLESDNCSLARLLLENCVGFCPTQTITVPLSSLFEFVVHALTNVGF
jgi:hypothetical protein